VLGINYSGMHDSSICHMSACGEIHVAVSEERFSRVRHDGRFPSHALRTVDLNSVDIVAVPYLERADETPPSSPVFEHLLPRATPGQALPYPSLWLERLTSLNRKIRFFDHHEMHAYTGYYFSPFAECLVLTADYGAYGCPTTMGIFHVERAQVDTLATATVADYEALAALYSDTTALLGFSPCKHEGKVTGLAAHGRSNRACREALWETHARIRCRTERLYDWIGFLDEDVPPIYQTNPHLVAEYRAQLPFSDADIARAAQDILEQKVLQVADWATSGPAGHLPLVVAGGVFANVKLNLELARMARGAFFVCPPMGDDGLSVGAAARVVDEQVHTRHPRRTEPCAATLGPPVASDPSAELAALQVAHLTPGRERLVRSCAEGLAAGEVVALVVGRSEFGPRALGHRSILAAADDARINGRLNKALSRTEFMPFAPVLRRARFEEVFDMSSVTASVSSCLPYMTVCLPVSPWTRRVAPAVVHRDGTARPQVVSKEDGLIYEILQAYEAYAGLPLLINTSFNIHDEPLVQNTQDAVRVFFATGLDRLIIENCEATRAANPQWSSAGRVFEDGRDRASKARATALGESFGRQIVQGPQRFSPLSDTTHLLELEATLRAAGGGGRDQSRGRR
jgi:carbamoyltransferase